VSRLLGHRLSAGERLRYDPHQGHGRADLR
jgi:hypothetical protein